MLKYRKIKIGKSAIDAIQLKLCGKELILLRGRKGFIMCGYLDMKVARKFEDVAVRITGVSTIKDALEATAAAVTPRTPTPATVNANERAPRPATSHPPPKARPPVK